MKLQIFVLVQGFVLVARGERYGDEWTLKDCYQVTRWRGESGIGGVALTGPGQAKATLHKEGTAYCHQEAIVRRIDCDEEAWAGYAG